MSLRMVLNFDEQLIGCKYISNRLVAYVFVEFFLKKFQRSSQGVQNTHSISFEYYDSSLLFTNSFHSYFEAIHSFPHLCPINPKAPLIDCQSII
jgi:hypothetical protein